MNSTDPSRPRAQSHHGPSRRRFLQSAAIAGTATSAGTALSHAQAPRPEPHPAPPTDALPFLHGVASGDPLPDSVILWTRVTPSPDARPGSGLGAVTALTWQVARDPDFGDVVTQGTTTTSPEVDLTVRVDATGLAPDTTYFYRFIVADGPHIGRHSPVGRTHTAPAPDAPVAQLNLAVSSCANWEAGYFSAYRDMAERGRSGDLDLVVFLGDYIYEYETGGYAGKHGVVRPHDPAWEILTLADYRTRYGQYRTDPELQAAHAALPWVVIWDDHETANNSWREGAENHTEGQEGAWIDRRNAAMQAYFEWLPVRATSPSRQGHIYRSLRFGTLMTLTMMDLRTYRDEQISILDWFRQPHDASMMGSEQFEWLIAEINRSTTNWNVLGNSIMFAPLNLASVSENPQTKCIADFLGARSAEGLPVNLDMWDGYAAERQRVMDAIEATGTSTLFLTGDIHSEWGNSVVNHGREIACELVCTSVSSPNADEILKLPIDNPLSTLAESYIKVANPHVRHCDLDAHGYAIAHVRPDEVDMTWLRVDDVEQPGSPIRPAHFATWRPGVGFVR